ncbi:MAG: dihydrodipicolinate synthase family protein [Gemmatimonadales bacterium]
MHVRAALRGGLVIPGHPLALRVSRRLDERRQRALTRYYLDAGAGGLAVGVHTTQFAIHHPKHGLLRPVLELAIETARERRRTSTSPVMIAGVIGPTRQAVSESVVARELGYDAVLLGMQGPRSTSDDRLIARARAVAAVAPVMGFYLQPAVGGRSLSYRFWRRFVEVEAVVAIKVAPFDRYATLDVVRAVTDSGRSGEIALYTGNDDHILLDLLTPMAVPKRRPLHFVGGLLGHWAFWTRKAVEHHRRCQVAVRGGRLVSPKLLTLAGAITDANGAVFDATHGFRGCIPGIHEILRRQGLLAGRWCLDPDEELSSGQSDEIDRVSAAYPHLNDDEFVRRHLDRWLA